MLQSTYDPSKLEIGIDEVGRGPLFGRVYAAAVILPKEDFDYSKMKDSKKFHSKKKIEDTSEYIKERAIAYAISFEDEKVIDDINILQATQKCMHNCVLDIIKNYEGDLDVDNINILVDGNFFKPLIVFKNESFKEIRSTCVVGGDNKFASIAAASILAKVARDAYIADLCEEHPYLATNYSIDSNKGYGAKKHIDGIKEHGITEWHRKSFGICKQY